MTAKTVSINGTKLRTMLAKRGLLQKDLAEAIGVTHYHISRMCKVGTVVIRTDNFNKIAKAMDMDTEALKQELGVNSYNSLELTPAESEWVELYRNASPLEQAKFRLAIEEVINPPLSMD